jgi:hypothetical protein
MVASLATDYVHLSVGREPGYQRGARRFPEAPTVEDNYTMDLDHL